MRVRRRRVGLLLAALLGVILAPAAAGAFGIPGIGDVPIPGLDSGRSAGGASFSAREELFDERIHAGTANLLDAFQNIASATGNSKLAAEYAASARSIRSGSVTDEEFSSVSGKIDDTPLRFEDLEKAKSREARAQLSQSVLHMILANFFDLGAAKVAQGMVWHPPSVAELATSDVRRSLGLAKEAITTLPKHAKIAAGWTAQLTSYLRRHKVRVPSRAEARKLAAKQGISDAAMQGF